MRNMKKEIRQSYKPIKKWRKASDTILRPISKLVRHESFEKGSAS